MSSYETVAKLMTAMSANFVNYKLTKEAVVFNASILSDIPDDVLEAATVHICSKPGAFFPSVGDWRKIALDIMLNKAGIPSEYQAWEELISMIGKGPSRRLTGEKDDDGKWIVEDIPDRIWKNKIAERVAEQLGWPEFPDLNNLSYERHAFMEAYRIQCQRIDEDIRTLPGVKKVEQQYVESSIKQLTEGMSK